MDKYILRDKKPVPVEDLLTWAKQFESDDCIVKQEEIAGVRVSTVFLGLDRSFTGRIPILFETKIFGGELDGEGERYATWEQAEEGHELWVNKIKSKQPQTLPD